MTSTPETNYWKFWLKTEEVDSPEKLSGHLSFHWPYIWETPDSICESFMERLYTDTRAWLDFRLGSDHGVPVEIIKDSITFGYFILPSTWKGYENLRKDVTNYQKSLLFSKFLTAFFFMDDFCEARSGYPDHNLFMEEMAEISYQIFTLKYKSIENVLEDLSRNYKSELKFSTNARKQALFQDVASCFEKDFGYTTDQTKFFARAFHRTWDHHTWLGSIDYSHVQSIEQHQYFRIHSGGALCTYEFILLLEGITVPLEQRERKYWIRLNIAMGDLVHLSNDVLSYLKEIKANAVENSIMALTRENVGFQQALEDCCCKHDKTLEMYRETCIYLQNIGVGIRPGQVSSELLEAINAMNYYLGHMLQAQHCMKRYTTFEYKFVKSKSV